MVTVFVCFTHQIDPNHCYLLWTAKYYSLFVRYAQAQRRVSLWTNETCSNSCCVKSVYLPPHPTRLWINTWVESSTYKISRRMCRGGGGGEGCEAIRELPPLSTTKQKKLVKLFCYPRTYRHKKTSWRWVRCDKPGSPSLHWDSSWHMVWVRVILGNVDRNSSSCVL